MKGMALNRAAFIVLLLVPMALSAAPPRIDELRAATPEELAMKGVAFAPGAPAVILDWVQRHDDVDGNETEYVRIKILSAEGTKYGDVEISFLPNVSTVREIEARTTRADGTVVPFNGRMYEKLIVRVGGVRVVAKTFSLPDVQPGSIVEYRYHIIYRDGGLRDTKFTVQRELPVLRELLWLRPYAETYSSFFSYSGLPEGKKPVLMGGHYELVLENIPAFEEEPFSLPPGELKPVVNFVYTFGNIDPERFWLKEGRDKTRAAEEFIADDVAPIRNTARAAIGDAEAREEKLRRLYEVAQKIRNLGYEREKTAAEKKTFGRNRSAQDVLRNGYGSAVEITRLFVALARSAGFEAGVVRIAQRDEAFFAKNVLDAEQLDSELAIVKIDGREVLLDPGTPTAPFGLIAWQKGHVPGMRLVNGKDPVWFQTPSPEAGAGVTTRKAVLRVEGDVLRGTVIETYRGQEALARRLSSYQEDEAETKRSLETALRNRFATGADVVLRKVRGIKSAAPEVVAEYDVQLPNAGSFAASRAIIPLSLFHANARNPFSAATRKSAVYFQYPFIEEDDVTLHVPEGYGVESLPTGSEIKGGAIAYASHYENGAGTVRFTGRRVVDAMYFPVEKYGALRTIFSRIAAADQEQVVLRKR